VASHQSTRTCQLDSASDKPYRRDSITTFQASQSRHGPALAWVMEDWLTTNEAAAYLKVRPRTLSLWARQGKVPAHPLSGVHRRVWRFHRAELDAMLCVSSADSADRGQHE